MAKKRNKLVYVLIGAGIVIVIAIAGNKLGWFGRGDIPEVATEKAAKRTVTEMVSASGKVQPEIEVKLSSEVSGEIVELHVKEGDVVKKGQLLCKVKPDILMSGYNQAVASLKSQKAKLASTRQQLHQVEATFKNIEANYKRNTELYKQKVLSAAEYEASRAEYLSAKANLEAARQNVIAAEFGIDQSEAVVKEAADNLARTTIYAPVDGVVSKLEVELGERVVGTAQMAGTEIMRIANMNSMEVNVDVNENDINRVSLHDPAEIEIDAFRDKKFKGKVTEIASSANVTGTSAEQVTNFTVKVRILPESYEEIMKNTGNSSPFRPGLSATVDIHTKESTGLSVPIQSVTTRTEEPPRNDNAEKLPANTDSKEKKTTAAPPVNEYVFVYKDGKVSQVKVETGVQDDTYIRILSGLKGGEEIVSSPFTAISKTLKDGMEVKKVSKDKLFEGGKK